GLVELQSADGGSPTYLRSVVADKTVGLHAFGAICAALVRRSVTGRGDAVEVPMFESVTSYALLEHLYGLSFDPPTGPGGYERVMSPERRPCRPADGYLGAVVYDDRQWRAFFTAIDRPELAEDPRYADHASRTGHTDELYAVVAAVMPSRTTAQWLEEFRRLDIPAMAVASLTDVLGDDHLQTVGMFAPTAFGDGHEYLRVRNPLRFAAGSDDERRPPPALGEHTAEVLGEAGYSAEEIEELVSRGAAFGPSSG
ncbi:MAG: CoA transferase, partial [Acidimicrobiales bacterium]|nr:CoA transferase [Acidimicrobiales bacterium]